MLESTESFKKFANGKSWQQLSFQEQHQIRLMAIMEQASAKYGDTLADNTTTRQNNFIASLKNIRLNLGQAFLPIYNAVLPALNSLASKLETVTAHIAAFTQSLFGKATKTTVTQTQQQTGAIEDLGNATEKAGKQAKGALAGFDEINQLSDNTSGSGGGASGGSVLPEVVDGLADTQTTIVSGNGLTNAFSDLKRAINPTIKAFDRLRRALEPVGKFVADGIKSFYEDVLVPIGKWVLGEGLPRLLDVVSNLLKKIDWGKLTQSLVNFNKALAPFAISVGRGLISFIEILADILTPIVLKIVDAFALALDGLAWVIRKIPPQVAEALGGAIGGLVTAIIGFKMASAVPDIIIGLKGALTGLLGVLTAHPLLALAAGIGAIAGAMMTINKANFDKTKVGKYAKEVENLVQVSEAFNEEVNTMLKNHEEHRRDIEAEYGAVSILADEYFNLADKQSLTNEEQALMKSYAQELIGKIPELSGLIDDQTGAYKGTRDEIKQLINKTKEYYLVQAAQESLTEIAKAQFEAERTLSEQLNSKKVIQGYLNAVTQEYNEKMRIANQATGEATLEQKEAHREAGKLSLEIENLNGQLATIDEKIRGTKEDQTKLNTEWKFATEYIRDYSSTAETEVPKVENSFTRALTNIKRSLNEAKFPNLKIGIDVDTSKLTATAAKYGLKNISHGIVTQYASGGLPSTGEMFIAREAGPELVGRIGSSSAVANNDQIVSAVSSGVYSAVVSAMGLNRGSSGGKELVLNLDGREIARGLLDHLDSEKGRRGNNMILQIN